MAVLCAEDRIIAKMKAQFLTVGQYSELRGVAEHEVVV